MGTQIAEIREIVGRLDERTQAIQDDVAEIRKNHGDRINTHSGRLGSLERSRAKGRGAIAILAGLAAWVGWDEITGLWRH